MKKQVFISHQKRDRDEAEKIANYLSEVGVSVYFDEYDKELQIATATNNSKGVVNAIKKGINNSSHMLCIISPNTITSKWVPFEVGFGYEKTDLVTLTLKGINNSELPDYIKVAPIIRDIDGLNEFISNKFMKRSVLEQKRYSNYSNVYHPLVNVMDRKI